MNRIKISLVSLLFLASLGAMSGCGGGSEASFQNKELPFTYLGRTYNYSEAGALKFVLPNAFFGTDGPPVPPRAFRYVALGTVVRSLDEQTDFVNDPLRTRPSDTTERALHPGANFYASRMLVYVLASFARTDRLELTNVQETAETITLSFLVCRAVPSDPSGGSLPTVVTAFIPQSSKTVIVLPINISDKPQQRPETGVGEIGAC